MELGNEVFGNSRGNFSIERGMGWEDELSRLFDAIDKTRDTSWRDYGLEFENETFYTFPYYWGECNCGYDEKEIDFAKKVKHSKDCYIFDYEKLNKQAEFLYGDCFNKKAQALIEKELPAIYEKHNLEYDIKNITRGCAVRCSCDYEKQWQEWESKNSHLETCLIVRDNFHFKPNGFGIQWYKYPLRDSYKSHNITLKQFSDIIDNCIKSINL